MQQSNRILVTNFLVLICTAASEASCGSRNGMEKLSLVQLDKDMVVSKRQRSSSVQHSTDEVDHDLRPWWARKVPRQTLDEMNAPRQALERESKTEPSKIKMLCVVLCKTHEEFVLVNYMQKQLRQCDDFVVASNRSVSKAYKFQTETLIKGSMDSASNGLNPLNTEIFINLWKALAGRKNIETYDWIVKIDPDCFFRPAQLRLALSRYGNEAVIVAHRPNNVTHLSGNGFLSLEHYPLVKGDSSMWYTSRLFAMYAISKPIFDVFRDQGCSISAKAQPHEDVWWRDCMQTQPYKKAGAHLAQPEGRCVDFVWNAYVYAPKDYDGRLPITAEMIDNLLQGKTLYNEQGFCMASDITAFHPVKSPLAYRKLQRMFDGEGSKEYWDSASFSPAGGWSTSPVLTHGKLRQGCCDERVACLERTAPQSQLPSINLHRTSLNSSSDANESASSCFYHRVMVTYE